MSEPHTTDHAGAISTDHPHEAHISDKTFFKVFVFLFIFTAVSFITNQVFGRTAAVVAFIIIMSVAVVKAALVVMFFMHLKIDWRKVVVFVAPTLILAPLIVIVLWPDIVLAWRLASAP